MPGKEVILAKGRGPTETPLTLASVFGNLVFVAGITGVNPTTGQLGKDVKEQTKYSLERVGRILEEAGSSLDDVLTADVYLKNQEDWQMFGEDWTHAFPSNRPSRIVVITPVAAGVLVEIKVIACIPIE